MAVIVAPRSINLPQTFNLSLNLFLNLNLNLNLGYQDFFARSSVYFFRAFM